MFDSTNIKTAAEETDFRKKRVHRCSNLSKSLEAAWRLFLFPALITLCEVGAGEDLLHETDLQRCPTPGRVCCPHSAAAARESERKECEDELLGEEHTPTPALIRHEWTSGRRVVRSLSKAVNCIGVRGRQRRQKQRGHFHTQGSLMFVPPPYLSSC